MSTHHPSAAIGVFDSGIGGLTVAREIASRFPHEDLLYLGDTARLPYGTKSPETVVRYAHKCVEFLAQQPIKAIVVACNSASAAAVPDLRRSFDVPVLGVIGPGARAAARATQNRRIGVIGTRGTVRSRSYDERLAEISSELQVFSNPAPLLVNLAEEGWVEGEVPQRVVETYLEPLLAESIDTLVLGCTHYPLFKPLIARWFATLERRIALVDSAVALTDELEARLAEDDLLRRDHNGRTLQFYATDDPTRFRDVGRAFFGHELDDVRLVDI
ncbi:MAG: glutamate racemase [Myxococcales bacterium]|nr:glutamate racemase [Myxococcales bacterium]